jgi:hypothetical protein
MFAGGAKEKRADWPQNGDKQYLNTNHYNQQNSVKKKKSLKINL